MQEVRGDDLVKICSLYENYKFRTPQRLLRASPPRHDEGTTARAFRRRVMIRQEQMCQTYRLLGGTDVANRYRKPPTGKLQIRRGGEGGDEWEEETDEGEGVASTVSKLRRCKIGDKKKSYKHVEPPLMVTPSKLPSIFTKTRCPPWKESAPSTEEQGGQKSDMPPLAGCEGPQGDKHQRGTDGENEEDEDELSGDDRSERGRKAVSFGGARIVDDRKITKGWSTYQHPHASSIHLKYPSSGYQQAQGEHFGRGHKVLIPRKGRLHVRFNGKRCKPTNPATARVKADEGRGIKPTQPLPPRGVSILKPAKPFMAVPTPSFPCSPEFERTFKNLRGNRK